MDQRRQRSSHRVSTALKCEFVCHVILSSNVSKTLNLRATSPYRVGVFEGSVGSLKVKSITEDMVAIVVAGKATPDGTMYNSKKVPKQLSTAREHDSLPVRFWNRHLSTERSTIWYLTLQKVRSADAGGKQRYVFSSEGPINLLKDTGLQSPTLKIGDASGDFDISRNGIIFIAQNPNANPAKYFGSDLYYMPVDPSGLNTSLEPRLIDMSSYTGACESPIFSPDGTSVAFVKFKEGAAWYGQQRLYFMNGFDDPDGSTFNDPQHVGGSWPLSPDYVRWGGDSRKLYVLAQDQGRCKLFGTSMLDKPDNNPEPLVVKGCVSDIHPFMDSNKQQQILVTRSSFVDSSIYSIVDPSTGSERIISNQSNLAAEYGISASQISEIWFQGRGDYNVHAFVVKPSTFIPTKTYPVAFMLHGGPASAFLDAWSTRWNPVLFAEQGYIIILPNFTGSTGYGPEFMKAIKGDCLGRPYDDIVNCFYHVQDHLPFADTTRAVALGGSFGGFMVNWIAGHELGKEFKALVNHQGMLNISSLYGVDVMDMAYDFGGEIWEVRENYERFDPGRFTQNWTTPMLVIASDWDFRCPVTEGLAAFTVLKSRGVEAKFLNFEDEGHWVLKPENSLRWYSTVLGWINRFSGVEGGIESKKI